MRIDSQLYVIDQARHPYPGVRGDGDPLRKDYTAEHVERILKRNRFDRMVVHAVSDSVEETRWLLGLAQEDPFIAAVVGWVDLTGSRVGAVLDELQAAGRLRAIRSRPDLESMEPGLRELASRNLPLEVDLSYEEAGRVLEVAERVPGLRIVVQHTGNPIVEGGDFESWAAAMSRLSAAPPVSVKISRLVTPAVQGWRDAEFAPYIRHLFVEFGPRRLLFASDWPFCLRAVDSWKKVLAAFTQGLGAREMEDRALMLGENAMELYRIPSEPESQNCSPAT